jgi:two-component system response regulator QseB
MADDHAYFSGALELVLGPRLYGGLLGPGIFHHATTVKEALKLVAEADPFDLGVVNLMLPDGDGTDVVRAVKERWPETPVCVLSGVEDLSGALSAGADEAIPKSTPCRR